ncbi:MAG: hypothetical protein QM770_08115 [Tepidisphaeraceae bacterium]
MPITATCTNCGKSYQAPDNFAGRKVRCKDCGSIFEVARPAPDGPPEEPPDLSSIDFGAMSDDAVAASPAASGGPLRKGREPVRPRPADVGEEALAAGAISVRPNYRFQFAGSKEIDTYLPYGLIGVGAIVLGLVYLNQAETRDQPGIGIVRFLLVLLCYFAAVAPCVYGGMQIAGRTVGYQLPKNPFLRATASFIPALLLTLIVWFAGGGDGASFTIGIFVGSLLSLCVVWLLFRLFPNEVPLTGVFAIAGFLTGSALAIAVLFVLNLIVLSIVNAAGLQASMPKSPIQHGMPWELTSPPTAITNEPPKPVVPTVIPGGTTAPVVPTPPRSSETLKTILKKVDFAQPGTPAIDDTFAQIRPATKSPLLAALVAAPVNPGFDAVLRPFATAEAIGVVRADKVDIVSLRQPRPTPITRSYVVGSFGPPVFSPDAARMAEIRRTVRVAVVVTPLDNPAQRGSSTSSRRSPIRPGCSASPRRPRSSSS